MASKLVNRRDLTMKPREPGNLPPQKLAQVLGTIYPEEVVNELMKKLCEAGGQEATEDD